MYVYPLSSTTPVLCLSLFLHWLQIVIDFTSHQGQHPPPQHQDIFRYVCRQRHTWFPRSDCCELWASRTTRLIPYYMVLLICMYCGPVTRCHTGSCNNRRYLGLFLFLPLFAIRIFSSSGAWNLSLGTAALKGTWAHIDLSLLDM